jgi:molecular chaperone IbpA
MVIFNDPFIGNLAQEFEKVFTQPSKTTYPPYNIVKHGDSSTTEEYFLEFAVAGFSKDNININIDNGILSIVGEKPDRQFMDGEGYVYKGIAARKFSRSFTLPEHFEVTDAKLEDGMLYIYLWKNVPEEKKPKTITIN